MTRQVDDNDVLEEVLDRLLDEPGGDAMSVGDVVSSFADRSFGALVTVIGLIAAIPVTGAIPGMTIICASLSLLVAGQFAIGRRSVWIPSMLRNRAIERETLEVGLEKARPCAQRIDEYVKPRLAWVVGGPVQRRAIAVIVCGLALTMYPLALIPWGALPPALATMLFGISILGRDELFASFGFALLALTTYLVVTYRDTLLTLLSFS